MLLNDRVRPAGDAADRESARTLDRRTNAAVQRLCDERPELFEQFNDAEWDELYSEHGMGGALTAWGAAEAAWRIERKRYTLRRLALVLETHLGRLAEAIVDVLYESVRGSSSDPPPR